VTYRNIKRPEASRGFSATAELLVRIANGGVCSGSGTDSLAKDDPEFAISV